MSYITRHAFADSVTEGLKEANTKKFLENFKNVAKSGFSHLNEYGVRGVNALAAATPIKADDMKTATSWNYTIQKEKNRTRLVWTNSNVVKGRNIAILLQYGHGTRNGGYVQGQDYINKAMRPVFDDIANKAWAEVTKNG